MTIHFTQEETQIMCQALARWGIDAQIGQAIEECAELIVALQKHINRTSVLEGNESILDEMADVEIMLAQIRIALDIGDATLRDRIGYKLKRLCCYMDDDEM